MAILDRDVAARELFTPTAADTLQRDRIELEERLTAWTETVIALGSDIDEVTILQRAVDRAVAIGVGQLAGTQPDWLHHLIGPRPTDPIGATSWDAIVGDVVAWQQRHPAGAGDGLGPAPDDPTDTQAVAALRPGSAAARTRLTTSARHAPSWPVVRSHRELSRRHQELDAILDTAPADTRHVINAARSGQLALTDVDEIVRNANDARTARKHSIPEHWPHVVEYAEISTTLRDQTWGPDPDGSYAGIDDRESRRRPRHSAHRRSAVAAGCARRSRSR